MRYLQFGVGLMRLEWIEDILAVIDTGSLRRAAEKRLLTQSAFTRRIRKIEEALGAPLFDRSHKPVTLMSAARLSEPQLRDAAATLRSLRDALADPANAMGRRLQIATQHALTTNLLPAIVAGLSSHARTTIRVRLAIREQCLLYLLRGEADLAILYEDPRMGDLPQSRAFPDRILGSERLLPVHAPGAAARGRTLPLIVYPPDSFLGTLMDQAILPAIRPKWRVVQVCEAAFTHAALGLALAGVGHAWLPHALVAPHLAEGRLVVPDDGLPDHDLTIRLLWSQTLPVGPAGIDLDHIADIARNALVSQVVAARPLA